MTGTFSIVSEQAGQRLDRILPALLNTSRSLVQRYVARGAVTVNGKTVLPHYFVKAGDVVAWNITEEKIEFTPNAALSVPILFEDHEFLVIAKPAGLVVHQGEGHRASDTLANWLLATRPEVKGIGDDPLRPGIVHRLDRAVSGVMVIAKTPVAYTHLIHCFEQGAVVKEYEAIVYGVVEQPEVTLTFPLARSKTKGWKMAARPLDERTAYSEQRTVNDTREAITHVVRIAVLPHYTHLRILPKTGRMHQIRAHCAAFGHPIVGDTLYAGKTLHPEREARLYLHATRLRFIDLHGKERIFSSSIPEIFIQFLKEHT